MLMHDFRWRAQASYPRLGGRKHGPGQGIFAEGVLQLGAPPVAGTPLCAGDKPDGHPASGLCLAIVVDLSGGPMGA